MYPSFTRLTALPCAWMVTVSLAFASCDSDKISNATNTSLAPLLVTRGNFQSSIRLSGVLRATKSASIVSPPGAWGIEIRWMAEDGKNVVAGERVLEIDNAAIIGSLEASKDNVLAAQNDLEKQRNNSIINVAEKKHDLVQANYALAKAKLDAQVPKDAYPRRTYEDMQLAFNRATRERDAADKALATEQHISSLALQEKQLALGKAQRKLESVEHTLDDYVLKASRDGILVVAENRREGRSYRIGDKTWPGQVILEIPDLSLMNVEAELSDVDDGRLHIGMRARCVLDAFPEMSFPAKVTSISPVAQAPGGDSLRRAFQVGLKLEATDQERMRPGMSVQVELLDREEPDVLLIPRKTLQFEAEGVHALVASGETKPVVIGHCNAQECVLKSGLSENTELADRNAL